MDLLFFKNYFVPLAYHYYNGYIMYVYIILFVFLTVKICLKTIDKSMNIIDDTR